MQRQWEEKSSSARPFDWWHFSRIGQLQASEDQWLKI
uniref:Uncharacterized protein n=1 Tax=Nelumbo nucifera TaxID=4432 RepID=A0A822XSX3_NELNU|nr:TPA_asm: hypothetical protein HUJ06_024963 [Nelumbo nucifera]